jgi:hypothetical protein
MESRDGSEPLVFGLQRACRGIEVGQAEGAQEVADLKRRWGGAKVSARIGVRVGDIPILGAVGVGKFVEAIM